MKLFVDLTSSSMSLWSFRVPGERKTFRKQSGTTREGQRKQIAWKIAILIHFTISTSIYFTGIYESGWKDSEWTTCELQSIQLYTSLLYQSKWLISFDLFDSKLPNYNRRLGDEILRHIGTWSRFHRSLEAELKKIQWTSGIILENNFVGVSLNYDICLV